MALPPLPAYYIKRNHRKTLGIYIINGQVEVRAPLRYPAHYIDAFVRAKAPWIIKHVEASQQQLLNKNAFAVDYGQTIDILGVPHALLNDSALKGANHKGAENEPIIPLPPGLSPPQIKALLVKKYKELAKQYLPTRAQLLGAEMDIAPAHISITSAKTRWGSCSAKGRINFSWRLMMASKPAVDYVVIHELAHIKQMNHSKAFWAIVQKHMPHYKQAQAELKNLAQHLQSQDWD